MFTRVAELLLNQAEDPTRRTWVVFDELKEAGRLDMLPRLLTKGRSLGVRLAIGFQDIDGIQATYGDKLANELVGMCANKAILHVDGHTTATWAAQLIGEAEIRERTVSTTHGSQGISETVSEHIVKREAVLASELMTLPLPDRENFWGYYIIPAVGVYKAPVNIKECLTDPGDEPAYDPRDVLQQYLEADDSAAQTTTVAGAPTPKDRTDAPGIERTVSLDSIPRITRDPP